MSTWQSEGEPCYGQGAVKELREAVIWNRPEKKRSVLVLSPARAICVSFFAVIAAGTFLLMLPISARDGQFTGMLDALFTATSATCVTGLVVFDTATKWTPFGQVTILALIQVGGLGLVTITTFFNLAIGKKLGFRSIQRAQEAINAEGAMDINHMIRIVVKASIIVEGLGALLLMLVFVPKYGMHGCFISIFLAVSAFCNAGFDILGFEAEFISLSNYNANPIVIITITFLIIIGGLGFIVWNDLMEFRKTKHLILQTRVVLIITAILIGTGMAMFLICEWNNPATMANMPLGEKLSAAYFQSVTTRTAGFNTINIAAMHPITKTFSMLLMFIGAAPGSTGGGIKVTTLAVIIMTVVSVVCGREDTVIMKRKVAQTTVYKSLAIMVLAALLVLVAGAVMYFTIANESIETGIDTIFEAISAFATVGLSSGVTAVANVPSKLILILTMFTGRVGPISFVLSLAVKAGGNSSKGQIIPDGRLMVG